MTLTKVSSNFVDPSVNTFGNEKNGKNLEDKIIAIPSKVQNVILRWLNVEGAFIGEKFSILG